MLLGGALVNALAFLGLNYLFSMLRSSSVDEERKRHDKAVEQLQAAQANWSRRRTERLDWKNEEFRRQNYAVQTFRHSDAAICLCAQITGETLDPLGPSPSSLISLRRALTKKTLRSPSSSWERLQRAWWPTNSPSNPTVGG